MHEFDDLAARYISMWNETDPATRRARLEQEWTADARYCDPLATVTGPEQIDGVIAGAQASFPDLEFRLHGPVDGHHDQCRFAWELGPADGPAPVAGFDVVQVDEAGRITRVLGFLDRVPVG